MSDFHRTNPSIFQSPAVRTNLLSSIWTLRHTQLFSIIRQIVGMLSTLPDWNSSSIHAVHSSIHILNICISFTAYTGLGNYIQKYSVNDYRAGLLSNAAKHGYGRKLYKNVAIRIHQLHCNSCTSDTHKKIFIYYIGKRWCL